MSDSPHEDGVFYEDGAWAAWLNGALVAYGPDKPLIEAAYKFHAEQDQQTVTFDEED